MIAGLFLFCFVLLYFFLFFKTSFTTAPLCSMKPHWTSLRSPKALNTIHAPSPLLPCVNTDVISSEKLFSNPVCSYVVWVLLLCAPVSFSLNFLVHILSVLSCECSFTHCLLLPLDHPVSTHCKFCADIDY